MGVVFFFERGDTTLAIFFRRGFEWMTRAERGERDDCRYVCLGLRNVVHVLKLPSCLRYASGDRGTSKQ